MNAITTRPASEVGNNPLIPTTLDEAVRLAKIMSSMALVPEHLQGKPADCMLVIEQAIRWKMSPFAVAQATSVLSGKLNYEGKLVAAALHTSGILKSRLRYDYEGEGPGRAVRVSAVVGNESEPREVLVEIAKVKTNNSMWVKQPDQQLSYAGARIWARRHAPEVMLGVYAPEEFEEQDDRRAGPKSVESTVVRSEPVSRSTSAATPASGDDIPDWDAPPSPPKPEAPADERIRQRQAAFSDKFKKRMADVRDLLLRDGHDKAIAEYNAIQKNQGVVAERAKIRDEWPALDAEMQAEESVTLRLIEDAARVSRGELADQPQHPMNRMSSGELDSTLGGDGWDDEKPAAGGK